MEDALTVSLSPLQLLLSLAFQLWIVVFPILIIRKLNYLIEILDVPSDEGKDEG